MENKTQPHANQPEVFEISVELIVPSPFEAQTFRRKLKFETEDGKTSIDELGNSILAKGLLQPIIVRPAEKDKYEIVCGERRWLAHKAKAIAKIFTFVRDLNDEDTQEMQYYENHEREEPNALEDALRFKFYIDKGHSEEYIASRFSTTKKTVKKKIRLNKLIPEAIAELADGSLPLKHAYFLATFPAESQKKIVEREYAYEWRGNTNEPVTFDEFKELIERNIVRNLESAPFDKNDPRLHVTGLICPECPQRTGYDKLLFEDDFKGDSCLNESCFTMKSRVHLKNKQAEIAESIPSPVVIDDSAGGGDDGGTEAVLEKKIASVPLVTRRGAIDKKDLPVKGRVLTSQDIFDKPQCEFSVISLDLDKGQDGYVCENDKCPTHHPETRPPEGNQPSEQELRGEQFRFDAQVRFALREKVFAEAMKTFTDTNVFWQFDDLVQELLNRLWFRVGYDVQDFILKICKDWKNLPKSKSDKEQVALFVESLDKEKQSRLLFLFTFYNIGMYSNSDPAELEEFTYRFTKIDYCLVEQEIRLEHAPEEFKALAAFNVERVRNGLNAEVENFWWNEPKRIE